MPNYALPNQMKVGVALNMTADAAFEDAEMIRRHLTIADLIEPLGYDSVFVTEHHFTDYALTPSPFQLLAYLAGRTSKISLGTAVIVLPWHNPIRVAEEMLVLAAVSSGRTIFCFGRGTAGIEYECLGVPASESEDRFVDGIRTVVRAIDGHDQGPKIRPRIEVRSCLPLYTASTGGRCGQIAVELGLGQLMSGQASLEALASQARQYQLSLQKAGRKPSPPLVLALVTIRDSTTEAVDLAMQYLDSDWDLVDRHYKYSQRVVSSVPGYGKHQSIETHFCEIQSDPIRRHSANMELLKTQIIGSPLECYEKFHALQLSTGSEHMILEFGYGGMPLDEVRKSMVHFAHTVLPMIRQNISSAE